jgi:hypothetical protein
MASGLIPSAFFTADHASPTGPTGPVAYITEINRIEFRLKKTSNAFLEMERHIMRGDMDQVGKCEQTIQRAVDCIGEVLHTINPIYRTTVLSNAVRRAYVSSPNITEWYPDMMSLYMNRAKEFDRKVASDDDEPNMEVVDLETLASEKVLDQTPSAMLRNAYGVESLTYDLLRNSGSLQTGSEDTGRRSSSDNVNRFETLFAQCPYQILYRNPFDMSDDPRPYIIL